MILILDLRFDEKAADRHQDSSSNNLCKKQHGVVDGNRNPGELVEEPSEARQDNGV